VLLSQWLNSRGGDARRFQHFSTADHVAAEETLAPNTVTGGPPVSGLVTLECNAGPSGITVHLASSIPSVAQPASSSIVISPGQKTGNVVVTTAPVSATKKPSITAETVSDAQRKSKKLVVNP
jgi:hypothetical protein